MDYTKYTNIVRDLRDSPVYMLVGSESYILNLMCDTIYGKVKKKSADGVERHRFYADSTSAKDALSALENQGLFASTAVVIIHEIDKYGARDLETLASYIARPIRSTTLIMTAESIDKRKSLYKQLQKANIPVIEFKPTSEDDLAGWIRVIVSQKGKSISNAAIQALVCKVGGNPGVAAMEIKKLISFIGEMPQIESHHVEELVGRSRVDSAFDMCNAIARRNAPSALSIAKNLLDEGENEIGMLALLKWQFLRIVRAKSLELQNVPKEKIPLEVGVTFYQREFLDILKGFDYKSALNAYLALFDADISLRGKMLDHQYIIESLIITLCNA